jgi:Cytidylate kinase-like family/BON domain
MFMGSGVMMAVAFGRSGNVVMALLLISRGSFSGGFHISQCLSQRMGWKCLTREDLVATVNTYGELASRVTASIATAVQDYGRFSALRRPYKVLTQLALLDHVVQGDVAYFGYAGHLLLPGIPHAVKARILAPIGRRVALLREREALSDEAARGHIRKVDEERARWTRFMYGKNLCDPELFDLCINLDRVSFMTACSMLVHAARQEEFRATPESTATVRNRHLSARVLGALATDPRSAEIEIDATVEDGKVVLTGPYLDEPERAVVLDIARAVPAVAEVEYREGYSPPFDMLV